MSRKYSPGQSDSFTLYKRASIRLNASEVEGKLTVVDGSKVLYSEDLNGLPIIKQIGPFDVDAVVSVVNYSGSTGVMTLDVVGNSLDVPTMKTDPTTGQTYIAGPDGKPIKPRNAISSAFRLPPGTNSAALGSNADGYNGWCQNPLKRGEDVIGCRLRLRNCSVMQELEVSGIKVAADDKHMLSQNWQSAVLQWSPFLSFEGNQAVIVDAAKTGIGSDPTNNIIPALSVWSDPVYFDTKPRIDTVGAPRLMRFSVHLGPGSRIVSFGSNVITGVNNHPKNPGYKIASLVAAGALSNLTNNGNSLTEDGGQFVMLDVEWIYAGNPPLSMWTFGDSTFAAVGSGTNLLGFETLIATSNHAQSGQKLEDSFSVLKSLVEEAKPDYVYLASVSANSILTDAASLKAQQGHVMSTLMWLLDKGITPVLRSPVAYSGVPAALISQQDAWVRRLPAAVLLLDLRELSTSGWTLKTEYQSSAMDGTHWNDAAYTYEAEKLKALIS